MKPSEPKGTIRVQPRYTMECDTCGWRSYPYLEEDSAIGEWREHVRDHLGARNDGSPEDCPQCGWAEDCVCDKPTTRIDGSDG